MRVRVKSEKQRLRVADMMHKSTSKGGIHIHPLTSARWNDLEQLFGPDRGANSGCWCMWWRLKRAEWEHAGRTGRKRAFRKVVSQSVPGLLAYAGDRAIGWVAIGPRSSLPGLSRSPVCQSPNPDAAWSISCFYIDREYRRHGVMKKLIGAAVEYAGARGARIVEGYPVDPPAGTKAETPFTGIASAFLDCGFKEVCRAKSKRPVMSLSIR